ncbi:MAG TPA: hypothetical protein VE974_04310 [Thermoanaerobaculia bacterium]|nr:hypothetical protein [Thermoanaerobaculia bacterium]
MRSTRLFYALFAAIVLIHAAAASAAGPIDMDDPRRVVGRENNVRVDALLVQDTITPGSVVGITYQIQNLSDEPVAVASKLVAASYDSDSRTITLALGAEVPQDGKMPQVELIAPGEKKVFRGGATPVLSLGALRTPHAAPRFVQVKVSVLRNLTPFTAVNSGQLLSDSQFDQWFEANDTIFLNTIPVRFSPRRSNDQSAERADASMRF